MSAVLDATAPERPADTCGRNGGSALQVLGSGGPMHGQGRGSAAYLLWSMGRPSILIDVGGGTTVALARAGVEAAQLDAVLISHFHPDHVSDLPAFLWGEMVTRRRRPLAIAGPTGAKDFRSLDAFLEKQFGAEGAFPDMKGLLSGEPFQLELAAIETVKARASRVFEHNGLRVSAYPVPHGRAPTLAYRIEGPDFSVVFGGDQTGLDPGFSKFAQGADYLVLHAMLSPRAAGHTLAQVVALPETLGRRAAEAKAKRVVLGHLMAGAPDQDEAHVWSLSSMPAVIEGLRTYYQAPILVPSDLQCLDLDTPEDDDV
ncbi:MBL fold metallo-hydrolase [Luteimonas sp. B3_2_R+30]|uniref:MBL fold metallo-hydrolase n=2 Tax=Luteimonas salinilitoris TaxID=3237697 RepID=A0ABV4HZZ2_9GAMM